MNSTKDVNVPNKRSGLKVLISGPPLHTIGGIQNYLNLLLKHFKKTNINAEYFTQPMYRSGDYSFVFPFFLQFPRFFIRLNKVKPDVVHLNLSLMRASIIRDFMHLNSAKINGYPVVLFIRGWQWSLYKKIKKNERYKNLFVNYMNKADRILVLSEEFKEALVDLGIKESKIGLTSTMVDSDKFYVKNKDFRKPFYILFCSRMAKDKGIFELIDSIPLVLKKYPDTRFIFMGDGECLEELKSMVQKRNLEDNVIFTGFIRGKEKIDWYKKSHLFVFPTYHGEGFPNVGPEALAAGLPIITTRNAGLKRTIVNGENGFFLSSMPSDPKEIAHKILCLLDDSEKMKKMSEANIQRAVEKYDIKAVSREIENTYMMAITG